MRRPTVRYNGKCFKKKGSIHPRKLDMAWFIVPRQGINPSKPKRAIVTDHHRKYIADHRVSTYLGHRALLRQRPPLPPPPAGLLHPLARCGDLVEGATHLEKRPVNHLMKEGESLGTWEWGRAVALQRGSRGPRRPWIMNVGEESEPRWWSKCKLSLLINLSRVIFR
jgi:hypothetical protein